jgi:hypothetical protein
MLFPVPLTRIPSGQFRFDGIERNLALRSAFHIPQDRASFFQLVVANDQNGRRLELIGTPHLAFETSRLAFHFDRHSALSQTVNERKQPLAGF